MYRVRYAKRNRLGSVAQRSEFQGVTYASKMECNYAAELELRRRAGEITEIRRQVRIPLDVNGRHICNYVIDFVVTLADGTIEYVEVKGFETDMWRFKWKIFEALYDSLPGVRLTIVR